jgi:hypothetical protein
MSVPSESASTECASGNMSKELISDSSWILGGVILVIGMFPSYLILSYYQNILTY